MASRIGIGEYGGGVSVALGCVCVPSKFCTYKQPSEHCLQTQCQIALTTEH
jgi:hypothetical protein